MEFKCDEKCALFKGDCGCHFKDHNGHIIWDCPSEGAWDGVRGEYPACFKPKGINKGWHNDLEKPKQKVGHWITKESIKANMDEVINELETIFSDIREKNVDDSVCGLCEYDCDHGLDGYANECPGFERDDCFKLKKEYRNEWINKIIGEVTE